MYHETELFQVTLRWLHFFFGITWIGLLWFYNFMNVPLQKQLAADVKPRVNPKLLGITLAWFRHAAWLTVLMGVVLFWVYWNLGVYNAETARPIMVGGALGVIMMLNVWLIIWPNQKKVIAAIESGTSPNPKWPKYALNASRTNTILSFPMLFFMGAQSHWAALREWTNIGIVLVVFAILGWFLIWFIQMRPQAAKASGPASAPTR